jgi:hypothetical protein
MAFTVVRVVVWRTDTDFPFDVVCDADATPTVPTESAKVVKTTAAIFLFDDICMSSSHLAELSVTPRHRLPVINSYMLNKVAGNS